MGAPAAAVFTTRAHPTATWLRALQLWHLLSLDAPTVAFCWLFFVAHAMHVAHALTSAAALGCAVWLVYVFDRLLDARSGESYSTPNSLSGLYGTHGRAFLFAACATGLAMVWLLALLPRYLREAWMLLAIPLTLYGVAVHVLRLDGRWKALCVGVFFAAAVALPVAVQGGRSLPLLCVACAFGGVCRANCAVLRAADTGLRRVFITALALGLLPLCFGQTRAIGFACLLALATLFALQRARAHICPRVGWLTWRALVDAALVGPALGASVIVLLQQLRQP